MVSRPGEPLRPSHQPLRPPAPVTDSNPIAKSASSAQPPAHDVAQDLKTHTKDTASKREAPDAHFPPASISLSKSNQGSVETMHAALNDETADQIFAALGDGNANDFAQMAKILKTEGDALGEGKGNEIFTKLMVGKNTEQYQAMFQEAIGQMSKPPTAEEKANFIQFLAEGAVGVSEDDPSC